METIAFAGSVSSPFRRRKRLEEPADICIENVLVVVRRRALIVKRSSGGCDQRQPPPHPLTRSKCLLPFWRINGRPESAHIDMRDECAVLASMKPRPM